MRRRKWLGSCWRNWILKLLQIRTFYRVRSWKWRQWVRNVLLEVQWNFGYSLLFLVFRKLCWRFIQFLIKFSTAYLMSNGLIHPKMTILLLTENNWMFKFYFLWLNPHWHAFLLIKSNWTQLARYADIAI